MSDSLRPHESQHARPPYPSLTPGVHSDSRPSSRWCHPAMDCYTVLRGNELSRPELWGKLKWMSLSEKPIWKGRDSNCGVPTLWLSGKGKTKDITWSALTVGFGEVGVNRAHGILRVRKMEGIVDAWECAQCFNCARLFVTPWTAARQAPLSMGFSRQED